MNISLTPELEHFVKEKVNSGQYTSASEVIRESLRLLYAHDDLRAERIKQLNNAIDIGLSELDSGRKIPAKEAYNQLNKKIATIVKDGK